MCHDSLPKLMYNLANVYVKKPQTALCCKSEGSMFCRNVWNHLTSHTLQHLKLSQRCCCCWGFTSSKMWCFRSLHFEKKKLYSPEVLLDSFTLEDKGCRIFRNVRNHSLSDTASYPLCALCAKPEHHNVQSACLILSDEVQCFIRNFHTTCCFDPGANSSK